MNLFADGEIVRVRQDYPTLGLKAGDQGLIIAMCGSDLYEVEFFDHGEAVGSAWFEEDLMKLEDLEPTPQLPAHRRWYRGLGRGATVNAE